MKPKIKLKMKTKPKNLKIGMKINLFVTAIIVVLTLIIGVVSYFQITKSMEKVFEDRVRMSSELSLNWFNTAIKGDWAIINGDLYKGTVRMNDNHGIMESIGDLTGGAATIFQGDTRVATNVIDGEERATGTKADPRVLETVLKNGNEYIGKTDIVGVEHLTMYTPLKDKNGNVIGMWLIGPRIDSINSTITSLFTNLGVVIIISGIIAIVFSILFTRTIVRPILAINKQLKDISEGEGDLTKELQVKSKDEVGDLANSFNHMLGSLRDMIRQVGSTSDQVAAASEELTASAEETSQATGLVASSIQEVASGAEFQEKSAMESSEAMKELATGIQQVVETTSSVSELANETNQEANAGYQSIQDAITQMNSINDSVVDSAAVIKKLGDHSIKIGNIIEVITDIAEQTNLLALNAAIESARAGEHGKGFAVVADEVRKLAEQSKNSADEIAGLISQIQADTSNAVQLMDKGTKETTVGIDVVNNVGSGFQRILDSIGNVTNQIQEVSAVTEEMSAGIEQVNASLEEMARISQDSTSNSQQVAASSEEQMASMEEITASAESLSQMAEDLQKLVNRFKV
ncbi:methyl-accepting chemotaxis protein [Ornithinibacillus scapharcae]|uniref:methyl-accepting chemotaxis protein n=1 Tax=Ornithinibacillus scapharcae TaxID=1147159 RepID=UPI000225AFF6|nr:methyl-accepting chemotaxis protein [Ornithinibacillus scapharcae]